MLKHVYIFKYSYKSNTKGTRFELDKKQPLILGAVVERCSGSKLWTRQLYFTCVSEDFGHIFPTCSKKFTNISKVGCVTSFYQHFFVSNKICYYKTNSGNLYN